MKKTIAVFGGAFNPITIAHLSLAEQLINQSPSIEQVLFMPVGDVYEKKDLLPSQHRIQMISEAIKDNPHFKISTVECDAVELLYTIDSLDIIKEQYKDFDIAFIMGTDNLRQMSKWKEAERLARDFTFFIIPRDGDDIDKIIENDNILRDFKHNFTIYNRFLRNDESSSHIRGLIKDNKSIRYLVHENVREYIIKNNLYR